MSKLFCQAEHELATRSTPCTCCQNKHTLTFFFNAYRRSLRATSEHQRWGLRQGSTQMPPAQCSCAKLKISQKSNPVLFC